MPPAAGHDERAFGGDADAQRLRLAAFEAGWGSNEEALKVGASCMAVMPCTLIVRQPPAAALGNAVHNPQTWGWVLKQRAALIHHLAPLPQAVKERLVAPVFEQIHQHARATWSPDAGASTAAEDAAGGGGAAAAGSGSGGCEVPLVLLSIGASADHAFTCPDLVHYLRQKVGCTSGMRAGALQRRGLGTCVGRQGQVGGRVACLPLVRGPPPRAARLACHCALPLPHRGCLRGASARSLPPCLLLPLLAQGHPVALVNARDLSNGTPAPLLHSALRQFLGAPTPADDVAALVAWWGDELKERRAGAAAAAAAGGGATGARLAGKRACAAGGLLRPLARCCSCSRSGWPRRGAAFFTQANRAPVSHAAQATARARRPRASCARARTALPPPRGAARARCCRRC
jgi:hypothetical protein